MTTMPAEAARGQSKSVHRSERPRALANWLINQGEVVDGAICCTPMGSGLARHRSYAVHDGRGPGWMLREFRVAGSNGFQREARVTRHLRQMDIPVPHVVGEESITASTTFIVTRWINGGAIARDAAAAPDVRAAVALTAIDVLARIHCVDPDAVGLPSFATPYLQRQLVHMTDSWLRAGSDGEHDAAWRAVRARLIERRPIRQSRPMLLHGDFRLANLMVSSGAVAGLVDWQSCTAGDPLADLAWMLIDWQSVSGDAHNVLGPRWAQGGVSRQCLVDAYRQKSGAVLDELPYFQGLAQWRAATILQGTLARLRLERSAEFDGGTGRHLGEATGVLLTSAAQSLAKRC